jgi:hypothetical protein
MVANDKIFRLSKNSLKTSIYSLLIIIASIRGFFVIEFNFTPEIVYKTTALILVGTSLLGFIKSFIQKDVNYIFIKKLLLLNIFLGIFNTFVFYLLTDIIEYEFFYFYLAPYTIFLFSQINEKKFYYVFLTITLVLGFSMCYVFYHSLGENGEQFLLEYNQKLRPQLEAISRTGDYFRATGYTANYHDSASIMGMMACFFFARYFDKHILADVCFFLFAFLCLIFTQSAANIVIAIFVLFILLCSIKFLNWKNILLLLLLILSITLLFIEFYNYILIFAVRISPDGDWKGMMAHLDFNSISSSIFSILFGQGFGANIASVKTEVAIYKTILQQGIIHALIFFSILLYPLIVSYKKSKKLFTLSPALLPIAFSFLSLLHYGSLFRITSIYLFYALYALALKQIFNKVPYVRYNI